MIDNCLQNINQSKTSVSRICIEFGRIFSPAEYAIAQQTEPRASPAPSPSLSIPNAPFKPYLRPISGLCGYDPLNPCIRNGSKQASVWARHHQEESSKMATLMKGVFGDVGKTMDDWIGRTAHMQYLVDKVFLKMFTTVYRDRLIDPN
jgi:hypothetical protein